MENAKKDLKKEHIDGAFAMLNCRRNENAAWFHNYKIPKACFLPMEFLHCLLSHDLAYKKEKLKVICILPPIPNDPKADVCMEDEANKDLDDMADLSKRGYKFKIRDWRNMSVDLYGANEQIRRASLLFGNGGMSQASSSYQEESLESKINRISEMDTREPMNEITKETPGSPIAQQNIETPVLTPIQTQQETHELMNENILPNIQETHEQNKDVESKVQNTFEIGANVEISSQDDNTCHKWYPGNVLATYLVDGVEMVKVEIRLQPPPERPGAKKSYELMDDVEIEEEQTQSVNPSEGDGDKRGKAKAVACKKKKKANAQSVDLLPFLQREENRPIRPRNPPMPVTPEHINVAFEMLNCKRVEQGAWFRNNNLPAACFVPVRFLDVVGYAYESVRKPHKKKQTLLEGCVGELVKGLIHPKKVWLEDVDVIYGVIEDKLSYHYIGVEIQLIDNTITLFHCGLPKANIKRALNQIQELAVLISAIKMELLGEEVNFEDISPFQVKSLGLKSMANINDETAMDLRSKLCCEIFDQFMDKDFQEGQRK
ncbi:hypothetical protein Bca52824_081725 [Brassica carinata]|uniref:Uncharacterized protein n=1 Tax=Brassica carinata TaxID=52824 RepID=A0A8X7PL31_BRACI|nr:hypothetical protein Bca52824_081725 [Brassica carinata]